MGAAAILCSVKCSPVRDTLNLSIYLRTDTSYSLDTSEISFYSLENNLTLLTTVFEAIEATHFPSCLAV